MDLTCFRRCLVWYNERIAITNPCANQTSNWLDASIENELWPNTLWLFDIDIGQWHIYGEFMIIYADLPVKMVIFQFAREPEGTIRSYFLGSEALRPGAECTWVHSGGQSHGSSATAKYHHYHQVSSSIIKYHQVSMVNINHIYIYIICIYIYKIIYYI